MPSEFANLAALTLAVAAAAGIVAQSLARLLRIPGIVLLLVTGVVLGPDAFDLVRPLSLGSALPQVVGVAVAVILFEGGMNLRLERFRDLSLPLRRLLTTGAAITGIGAALSAHFILGWGWRVSALFGALVLVTGPTVVTPLVRRFQLDRQVGAILETEGVLVDAIGAVVAVVALEVALEPSRLSLARGLASIGLRLGAGTLLGLLGGLGLWGLLRVRGLVAEGLENVFVLGLVCALYQVAEVLLHGSGIAAVTVAGFVLGNLDSRARQGLLEFNDQLTMLAIGTLFVVLAANVRLEHVRALGAAGLLTVAVLVFVVRPTAVLLSVRGSALSSAQRLYVAWIGPRGIIAAAGASLFANRLHAAGVAGGEELRAMVFLVIATTVVLAGLTGGPLARLLDVRKQRRGWLVLGANPLALTLARVLRDGGESVTAIDSSAEHAATAAEVGIDVLRANALLPATLFQAHVELCAGALAVTPNDEVNLVFLEKVRQFGRVELRLAAQRESGSRPSHGEAILFGAEVDVELWSARARDGGVVLWRARATSSSDAGIPGDSLLLALAHHREREVRPYGNDLAIRRGDEATFAVDAAHLEDARRHLRDLGWDVVADG